MIMNDIFDSKGMPDVKTGIPVKLYEMRCVMNWGKGPAPLHQTRRNDAARNEMKVNDMMAPPAAATDPGADQVAGTFSWGVGRSFVGQSPPTPPVPLHT